MSNDCTNDFEMEKISQEAAQWTIFHDRGLTPSEQDNFFQWLAEDPRHGEAFSRNKANWTDFDLLTQWRPEHSDKPNPDLLAYHKPKTFIWLRRASIVLAVAAAFAFFVSLNKPISSEPENAYGDQTTYIVSDEYEYQVLEDGSEIDMNHEAEILVEYTKEKRLVHLLKGEVYFTVAKNPNRPFVVMVNGSEVIAVGTQFNIRYEEESVEVLVTEGRVRLEMPTIPTLNKPIYEPAIPASRELTIGQRSVRISNNDLLPIEEVDTSEIDKMLSWKHELFDFDSTPLSEVISAFNRRNEIQFSITDHELDELPIIASFRSNNVEGFARLLELTGSVKIDRSQTNRLILSK